MLKVEKKDFGFPVEFPRQLYFFYFKFDPHISFTIEWFVNVRDVTCLHQSYITFLLPHPTYVSWPFEYFTRNDWLRTELLGGSWVGLGESVRDLQCVTRRRSFFNNNIHRD